MTQWNMLNLCRQLRQIQLNLETGCIPDECEGCEWLNVFNLMCNKTYESLLNGCVCTERFTD